MYRSIPQSAELLALLVWHAVAVLAVLKGRVEIGGREPVHAVEGGQQAAEEEAEVRRRPHWRLVHRLLQAPCHSFQGTYHQADATPCCTCCYGSCLSLAQLGFQSHLRLQINAGTGGFHRPAMPDCARLQVLLCTTPILLPRQNRQWEKICKVCTLSCFPAFFADVW